MSEREGGGGVLEREGNGQVGEVLDRKGEEMLSEVWVAFEVGRMRRRVGRKSGEGDEKGGVGE